MNRADDGVDEERQTDRAEHIAAHVRDELQDALGQLIRRAPQRAKELMQNEPEIGARAETLQNRKS